MARIRVQNVHDAVCGPDTPIISAVLEFAGTTQAVNFLVDTGAANTSLNGSLIQCTPQVWSKGVDHGARGVGIGAWPSKLFQGATLVVTTIDGQEVRLNIPWTSLWAPFIDAKGTARTTGFTPGRSGPIHHQPCGNPNLLGRDVFTANGMALNWNPKGDSWIEIAEIKPLALAPDAASEPKKA